MSKAPPIPSDSKKGNGSGKGSPFPPIDDVATKVAVTGSGRVIRVDLDDLEELTPSTLEVIEVPDQPEEPPAPADPVEEYQPIDNRAFGRFELLIEMGRGGMATLYLARIRGPSNFEKLLAIKKIHDHLAPDEQFVKMFMDEARIAAMIHHPNVATIFDMGRIDKSYFIAMEYVHGQNLTDILKAAVREKEKFGWSRAVRIVADAAAGLHAAHELESAEGKPLGVVHRDVSPQNILVSYDGNVKVVDFGIAFAAEKLEQTQAGTLKGKVSYMSPEQAMGDRLDRRSDIFSLGTVLWECVCVKRLFKEAHEGATLLKVRDADVPKPRSIRPDLPVDLENIIMKALSKKREDRYETAEELSEALEALLFSEGEVVSRQKISKMLKVFFFDRRKLKDGQIKEALKFTGENPVKGVGMTGSDTHSLILPTGPTGETLTVVRPWLPTAIIVSSMAAVAIVMLLVFRPFFFKDSSAKKSSATQAVVQASPMRAEPMAPMREMPPPLSANVMLRIVIQPPLAEVVVTFRGKTYTGPIFQVQVKRSSKPETLKVTAPGYAEQNILLVPNVDNDLPVKLVKAAKGMRPRPMSRRRPMRRRSPMLKNIKWD
jgi:serine/threonine-protein kinase